VGRTSGPEKFHSSAEKTFSNSICHKQTLAELPESGRILDCGGRESGFAKGT
jgi:hypothetical protein